MKQTQKTVTTVAKKATKPAPKATAKAVAKAPQKAPVRSAPASKTSKAAVRQLYMLTDAARPSKGTMLYAHTHAAFDALGMLKESRPSVLRSTVQTLIGQRALRYHLQDRKNLEAVDAERVRMTPAGVAFFRDRLSTGRVSKPTADAFYNVFVNGKADAKIHVKQTQIVAAHLSV